MPAEKAGVTWIGLPISSVAVLMSKTLSMQAMQIHKCVSAE